MRQYFQIIYILVFSMVCGITYGQSYSTAEWSESNLWQNCSKYPKSEVRAVWLTTIMSLDWPKTKANDEKGIAAQKQELCSILDKLAAANINTVILQTRLRGSVIYPSKIEPWDECLTGHPGKDPGYDPLAFAVSECHKRGMELHCWLVSIPLGDQKKQNGYGASSIMRRHPELCKTAGDNVFMRIDNPAVGDYIAAICKELCNHYDIDGISLDYIRYPEKSYNYSDSSSPSERRHHITSIVRKIHDAVKPIKPWVKLSSSPIGKYKDLSRYSSKGWNSYDAVYQEAQNWLRDNIQDLLFPMMYFRGDSFYPFLYDWREHTYSHPVVPGLGIYFLDPAEGNWVLNDVRSEINVCRNTGIGGVALYRSDFFTRNCKGLYTQCRKEFFSTPSLTPRMTWSIDTVAPTTPCDLYHDEDSRMLYWIGSDEQGDRDMKMNDDDYVYYNLYGSDIYPVDVSTGKQLIKTRIRSMSFSIPASAHHYKYYAITACDRFGNESKAAQESLMEIKRDLKEVWNPRSRISVDGSHVNDRTTSPFVSSGSKKKGRK